MSFRLQIFEHLNNFLWTFNKYLYEVFVSDIHCVGTNKVGYGLKSKKYDITDEWKYRRDLFVE